jgi:hypothetical protein
VKQIDELDAAFAGGVRLTRAGLGSHLVTRPGHLRVGTKATAPAVAGIGAGSSRVRPGTARPAPDPPSYSYAHLLVDGTRPAPRGKRARRPRALHGEARSDSSSRVVLTGRQRRSAAHGAPAGATARRLMQQADRAAEAAALVLAIPEFVANGGGRPSCRCRRSDPADHRSSLLVAGCVDASGSASGASLRDSAIRGPSLLRLRVPSRRRARR